MHSDIRRNSILLSFPRSRELRNKSTGSSAFAEDDDGCSSSLRARRSNEGKVIPRKINQSGGFTLIEVLIALMILAIALFAIVKATQYSIRDTSRVRNKITAHWVAMNVFSEMQIGMMAPPRAGHPLTGTSKMLNQHWVWEAGIQQSTKDFEIVSIKVRFKGQIAVIDDLVGYVKAPD